MNDQERVNNIAPVNQSQLAQPQAEASVPFGVKIKRFLNIDGVVGKKDFANGFVVYITAIIAVFIVAVILFVIAGAISDIKIEGERTSYFSFFQKEDPEPGVQFKISMREGFSSLFSTLAIMVSVFGAFVVASCYSLYIKRLKDAGLSLKNSIFLMIFPMVLVSFVGVIIQFISPGVIMDSMAELLSLDIGGAVKDLGGVFVLNLLAGLLALAVGVWSTVLCFIRPSTAEGSVALIPFLKNS